MSEDQKPDVFVRLFPQRTDNFRWKEPLSEGQKAMRALELSINLTAGMPPMAAILTAASRPPYRKRTVLPADMVHAAAAEASWAAYRDNL